MAVRLRPRADTARRWTGLIALFFVATGLSLLLWTILPVLLLDWEPVAISSGSMEPGIRRGDVVVTKPFDSTAFGPKEYLPIGAVVLFGDQVDPRRVTHRILAVTPDGAYVTKGDANPRRDSTPVQSWQIIGVAKLLVPMIGQPVAWLHDGQKIHLAGFSLGALAALSLAPAAFAPVPVRRGGGGRRLPKPVGAVVAWAHRERRLAAAALLLGGLVAVFGTAWRAYGGIPPMSAYALTCAVAAWGGLEVFGGRRRQPSQPATQEAPEMTAEAVLMTATLERRRQAMFATGTLVGLTVVFVAAWLTRGLAPHLGGFAMVVVIAAWWTGRELLRPMAVPSVPSAADLRLIAFRRRRCARLASVVLAVAVLGLAAQWANAGDTSGAVEMLAMGAVGVAFLHPLLARGHAATPLRFVAAAASRYPRTMFATGAFVGLVVVLQGFGVANAVFASTTDNAGSRIEAARRFSETVLHLHNFPTPPTGDTASQVDLPMDEDVPTAPVLYNYDIDRDAAPGLLLTRSSNGLAETDPAKHQVWLMAGGHRVRGRVDLTLWSAMKDFDATKRGVVLAGLYDCDSNGSNCTQLASTSLDLALWGYGAADWVEHELDFGTLDFKIKNKRTLALKIVVADTAEDDMWFAYDTVGLDSQLRYSP